MASDQNSLDLVEGDFVADAGVEFGHPRYEGASVKIKLPVAIKALFEGATATPVQGLLKLPTGMRLMKWCLPPRWSHMEVKYTRS
jgi:hypothetical protein